MGAEPACVAARPACAASPAVNVTAQLPWRRAQRDDERRLLGGLDAPARDDAPVARRGHGLCALEEVLVGAERARRRVPPRQRARR